LLRKIAQSVSEGGGGGASTWDELTDKPTEFPPEAHTHPQSEVTGLVSALAAKAPLVSPALTGTPTVPTAAPGTNSTQAASTAFVTAAVAAGGVSPAAVLSLIYATSHF
jgi:hypothetical protein